MPITKRLQYVQLGNGAWIDTGIQASNTIKSQIKFEHVSTDGDIIFGTSQSDTNDYRMFCSNNKFYFDKPGGSGVGNRLIGGTLNYNTIYEVEVGTRYVKDLETGNNIVSGDTSTFEIDNIGLSKIIGWGTGNQSVDKWYYVKMWDGDNLIRDMIPVMRDNGETVEAGMYDKVTETFFGNAGNSGTIIAGPEIYKHISKVMCGDNQIYPAIERKNYILLDESIIEGSTKTNMRSTNGHIYYIGSGYGGGAGLDGVTKRNGYDVIYASGEHSQGGFGISEADMNILKGSKRVKFIIDYLEIDGTSYNYSLDCGIYNIALFSLRASSSTNNADMIGGFIKSVGYHVESEIDNINTICTTTLTNLNTGSKTVYTYNNYKYEVGSAYNNVRSGFWVMSCNVDRGSAVPYMGNVHIYYAI